MKRGKATFYFIITGALFLIIPGVTSTAEEIQIEPGNSKILILAPKEGDVLPAGAEVQVDYRFIKGAKDNGNHVHVYVDGENEGTTRRSPRGLGVLTPGKHSVLLKVSNQDHEWINVEASVQFEVGSGGARK